MHHEVGRAALVPRPREVRVVAVVRVAPQHAAQVVPQLGHQQAQRGVGVHPPRLLPLGLLEDARGALGACMVKRTGRWHNVRSLNQALRCSLMSL